MKERSPATARFALGSLLLIATLLAYGHVRDNEFLYYDDDVYVTENPMVNAGLTSDGLRWAFFGSRGGNWHPVTWLSHMLDVQLFGLDARAHHLMNLGLHALNVLLLFALLIQLTQSTGRSAFAAALFALHPLQVETVAWIAERKSLLSTLFGFVAIGFYARFARGGSRLSYAMSLAAFAASLGAKATLVTLPFALLLLDAWPLDRMRNADRSRIRALIVEKTPFFAMSVLLSLLTVLTQWAAISTETPFPSRVANAVVAYARYLGKFFWPSDLIVIYPYPEWATWQVLGALVLLGAITALVWQQRKQRSWLPMGWLWFLGIAFPTIGLVQVGGQSLADRYMYVPIVGLAVAATWTAASFVRRGRWLSIAGIGLLAVVGATTHAQTFHWKDMSSLFGHAVRSSKENPLARTELGIAQVALGRPDLGVLQLDAALALRPQDPRILANHGWALVRRGDWERGVAQLRRALQMRPNIRYGAFHLAVAFEMKELWDEAIEWHLEQLGLDPTWRASLLHLSRLLAAHPDEDRRNGTEALRLANRACAYRTCTEAWEIDVFAMALMEAGRPQKAVNVGQRAVKAALGEGSTELADAIGKRVAGYANGQPYRLNRRKAERKG